MPGRQLTDQHELCPGGFELLLSAVQLDRVCLAINSAVVAQPDQCDRAITPKIAQPDVVAVLVRKDDVGQSVGPLFGRNGHRSALYR